MDTLASVTNVPQEIDLQELRGAIEVANVPTLLMVVVQLTGDRGWLEEKYQPTRTRGLEDNDTGGLDPEVQREIREAAFDAIAAWHDGTPPALVDAADELLMEMLSICMGEEVPMDYAPIVRQEVARATEASRARVREPSQPRDGSNRESQNSSTPHETNESASEPELTALIIGAGISGLGAAVHLDRAGIGYTILEKGPAVGGVWRENRYPGCGVDTPSHLYTFSFAQNDWEHYFALRDEIKSYIERIADDFDINRNIRFNTEALAAEYSEEAQLWTVRVREGDGTVRDVSANLVISAVGAFNKPKMPNIKGRERFEGPAAHTARWPKEGIDLEGKRVGVIGTGASAMQVVPEIADTVDQLIVFQRSPQWAAPFEKFRQRVPDGVRYLLETVPYYYAWYRLRLAWAYNDKIHPSLQKDPEWPHPERSLNSINEGHRKYFTRHIVKDLGDRQDLLEDVVPDYPPYGKRILLDNGWYRTLAKDNVQLVTQGVREVTADSIIADEGQEVPVDVVIYATGFDVVHFLAPMEVRGRGGVALHDVWDGDDARAFIGASVPDFPNFFCLYGPNTQFGHGGSVVQVLERQMHYLMKILDHMRSEGIGAIEVKRDVYTEYNERIDAAHERMVWTHPGMETYYRNSRGRVVVNNPFRIVDYWQMTQQMDPDNFETEPRRGQLAAAG